MGHKLKTTLPVHPSTLRPKFPDYKVIHEKEEAYQKKMADQYNKRHRAKDQEPLKPGDKIFIPDMKINGIVVRTSREPISYIVKVPSGTVQRNRRHLRKYPGSDNINVGIPSANHRSRSECLDYQEHHVRSPEPYRVPNNNLNVPQSTQIQSPQISPIKNP